MLWCRPGCSRKVPEVEGSDAKGSRLFCLGSIQLAKITRCCANMPGTVPRKVALIVGGFHRSCHGTQNKANQPHPFFLGGG